MCTSHLTHQSSYNSIQLTNQPIKLPSPRGRLLSQQSANTMSRIPDVPALGFIHSLRYKYAEIDMRRDLPAHLTRQSYIRFGVCSWGVIWNGSSSFWIWHSLWWFWNLCVRWCHVLSWPDVCTHQDQCVMFTNHILTAHTLVHQMKLVKLTS